MAGTAHAVQTKVARTDSYEELSPGKLHSVTLSDKGRLALAPELRSLYRMDAEIAWAIAVAPDGRLFYGTGHEGKIFVVDRKSSGTLFLDTDAPEVTSLLFHAGELFAATAPDGKLWVCDKPGTMTLVYDTKEKYIWDMVVDRAGNFIVATGPEGKIFKVNPAKKEGELLFDSPDEHVLSLAIGPKGRLHAGTQGKGRVYRWDDDRKSTPVVLLEDLKNEVRKIVIDPDGNIFAALNSEVTGRRVVSSLPSSSSGSSSSGSGSSGSSPSATPSVRPSTPAGKSEIRIIDKEGFVRELWSVSEAPVHDMTYDPATKSVLIASGGKGKIFRLDARGRYSIVSSVEEEQVFSIEPKGKQFYMATVGPSAAYRLSDKPANKGTYLSPAIDAEASVRWGTLRREGNRIGDVKIETRSGNTAEPDDTWYEWEPVKWNDGPNDGRIQSPVAGYLQWRATFQAERNGSEADLDYIEVFYVPANEAPQIKEIDVKKSSASRSPSSASKSSSPSSSGSRPSTSKSGGSSGQDFKVGENSNAQRIEIAWQVSDPNDDPLESALYFKGEDETVWKLIKDELKTPKYVFGTGSLPDGEYRIKVIVTDRLGNYAPNVRKDELVSDRFTVDNTAPEISKIKAAARKNDKGRWRIEFKAEDKTSLIAAAKYNINGQELKIVVPVDGLFDERAETFEFDTDPIEGEEHVLGIVVTDREGNSTVGRAILRP